MDTIKKIAPYIMVAIAFGLVGYFIGRGVSVKQDAAVYRGDAVLLKGTPATSCPSGNELVDQKCIPSLKSSNVKKTQ